MSTLSSESDLATRSFSRERHAAARGLLAVSQRGVKNSNAGSPSYLPDLRCLVSSQSMWPRNSAPTFSIGCSRSAFISRLNSGMPASFSAIQCLQMCRPEYRSDTAFIAAREFSSTTRGPLIMSPHAAVSLMNLCIFRSPPSCSRSTMSFSSCITS